LLPLKAFAIFMAHGLINSPSLKDFLCFTNSKQSVFLFH
jgi:hypothetical protein